MLCGFSLFSMEWIYELIYYIGIFFCKIIHLLYQMFRVIAGTQKVTYYKNSDYLINIFFSNTSVTTIYAGMALIGMVLLCVFTILAIVKKMFDLGDKMQQPLGEILRKALSSFLFILLMNVIMMVTINVTNTLLQSVEYLFVNAKEIQETNSIEFHPPEYATMARIYDTIGNYSVNPSYQNRYNINSCYNEIRYDMQQLETLKVFNFTYEYKNSEGEEVETWQSVLAQIARAHDLSREQPLDEYNVALSAAILHAMDYVTVNNIDMNVLTKYDRQSNSAKQLECDLDVVLWLVASTDAATNTAYNGDYASLYDPVRGAYMNGERSIYDLDQVEQDFSLDFSSFSHLLVIIGGFMLCKEFFSLVINSVARIFNMLLLYLVAPPFLATAPYDDGSKFKQWSTAFIIQSFSVFGSVISIRILILILPIIFDSNLVILNGGALGMATKVVIAFGAAYTARKGGAMFGGILAENAGMQSIYAGDAASSMSQGRLGRIASGAMGIGTAAAGGIMKGGLSMAGKAGKGIIKSPYRMVRSAINSRSSYNARTSLQKSMKAGGETARRAGSDFLSMDKGSAMKKFGMNSKEYQQARNEISGSMERLGRGGGGGGSSASPGPMKEPPATNISKIKV